MKELFKIIQHGQNDDCMLNYVLSRCEKCKTEFKIETLFPGDRVKCPNCENNETKGEPRVEMDIGGDLDGDI